MADQAAIDSLASKFQAWAESLSPAEQRALSEWLAGLAGRDVSAHWDANWWEQPGAWSWAWTDSWKSE
jgi:hypothetical protein